MPTKLRPPHIPKDDLAWERNDEEAEAWERSVNKAPIWRAIGDLIVKYRPGKAVELHRPIRGGYNVFYRLEYDDGSSAAMRIPCKGGVRFPEEKVLYEAATMRYISANTTIPIPKIYHCGTAEENATGLGPFMIMDYVEHERTMSEALKDPSLGPEDDHVLDPDISEEKLEFLYRQMADILLQLSTLKFPRIGPLTQDEEGSFSISGRPLIQNMNSLVEYTSIAPTLLPSRQYSTADEWYSAMADMHMSQFIFQRNDAVKDNDEDDARDKYVARQLFRRLASNGRRRYRLGVCLRRTAAVLFRSPLVAPVERPRELAWCVRAMDGSLQASSRNIPSCIGGRGGKDESVRRNLRCRGDTSALAKDERKLGEQELDDQLRSQK